MNLRKRIWSLPAAAALIFAIGAGVVAWLSQQTNVTIDRLGQSDYPYQVGVTAFGVQLDSLVAALQSAVAEGEKERLKDIKQRAEAMTVALTRLQALPGRQADVQELQGHFERYNVAMQEAATIVLGVNQGDQAKAIQRMQDAFKSLSDDVSRKQKAAQASMDAGLAAAHHGVGSALAAMLASGVGVLAVLGIGSAWLARSIWRDVGGEPAYAREVLQRIAGGDLASPVEVAHGADASLLAAVRQMSAGLSGIVATVREGSDSMAAASSEIALGNQDLSQRTERTASSLQQTASSVTQLSSTVHQAADSARTANQLAGAAAGTAQRGGEVVAAVVRTMEDINASSRRIADIIGVIDGIAFQTNILALNAAVEAARAGEQGRGFAVVASEVRALAQRSATAAREIKELIQASVGKVDSGTQLVTDAGQTMEQIVASVQRVSDVVGEISAAASEQSQGIAQVDSAVGQLDQMTQQNAALVEQSAAAAQSLRDQAARLASVVATFRLPRAEAAPQG